MNALGFTLTFDPAVLGNPAVARQIVIAQFAVRGGRGAIEFSDCPVKREVVDAEANVTPPAFAIRHYRF
ncbi:MAG: hypothetical protein ACREAB_11005 [Blastocatellia bacterium]